MHRYLLFRQLKASGGCDLTDNLVCTCPHKVLWCSITLCNLTIHRLTQDMAKVNAHKEAKMMSESLNSTGRLQSPDSITMPDGE